MNIYVSYLIVNIFRCYKITHYIYKVIEFMQKRTNNYAQSITHKS